jgi:hypothetical protein
MVELDDISKEVVERALNAMHWMICPYTTDDLGTSLHLAELDDAPHIYELAQSYNKLIEQFALYDFEYIEFY